MKRNPEVTYRIMSAIKAKNTSVELLLGQALWKEGIRYRKHYSTTGKPDFACVRLKIAIFCDGDFWHGNNWRIRGLRSLNQELRSYTEFWRTKIKNNIKRDRKINKLLIKNGWHVIRFWESELRESASACAKKVLVIYKQKMKDLK